MASKLDRSKGVVASADTSVHIRVEHVGGVLQDLMSGILWIVKEFLKRS